MGEVGDFGGRQDSKEGAEALFNLKRNCRIKQRTYNAQGSPFFTHCAHYFHPPFL